MISIAMSRGENLPELQAGSAASSDRQRGEERALTDHIWICQSSQDRHHQDEAAQTAPNRQNRCYPVSLESEETSQTNLGNAKSARSKDSPNSSLVLFPPGETRTLEDNQDMFCSKSYSIFMPVDPRKGMTRTTVWISSTRTARKTNNCPGT